MRRVLNREFFSRPAPLVAKALLGKFLVRRLGGREVAVMITETEAYDGFGDKGSHAYRGKTSRTWPMFGPAGYWYIYFTYGMHWLLNVVAREENYPAAVLIRGAQYFGQPGGRDKTLTILNGPARLTRFLKITGSLNAKPACRSSGLWLEDRGIKISAARIKTGPRIGIDYAGPYWARRHWRFWLGAPK